MKKLVAIAALLMATTSAHAGGTGITFEIDGQRVHVEAPRNCSALSCIRISAPGYSGTIGGISKNFGSKSDDAEDVAATSSPPPAPTPAPAQVAAPQPAAPVAAAVPPLRRSMPPPLRPHRPRSQRSLRRSRRPRRLPQRRQRRRPDRSASGPRRRTRAMSASKPAVPVSAAIPRRPTNAF
jgi:hypothetical protein